MPLKCLRKCNALIRKERRNLIPLKSLEDYDHLLVFQNRHAKVLDSGAGNASKYPNCGGMYPSSRTGKKKY